MSKTTQVTETIVTEYKTFNINSLSDELNTGLQTEIDALNEKTNKSRQEYDKMIDGYQALHQEHKDLQKSNYDGIEPRVKLLSDIGDENDKFYKFAIDIAEENNGYRNKIADLEGPLRKLQDEITDFNKANSHLQSVIDSSSALKDASSTAVVSANSLINDDLQDLNKRLTDNLSEGNYKDEAQRVLDDLTKKYDTAKANLEKLLEEAKQSKQQVEDDLGKLRDELKGKRTETEGLRIKANDSDKLVSSLRERINQLTKNLAALRVKNEEDIHLLEDHRVKNNDLIYKLLQQLSEYEHTNNKLKNNNKASHHENVFLSSEVEKLRSQHYQKKIDDVINNAQDSELNSKVLADELERLIADWNQRLQTVKTETEDTITSNEHQDHVQRLERLLYELGNKNKEIEDLQKLKDELLKKVSDEPSDEKDGKNKQILDDLDKVNKDMLDALNEKNDIYDQLVGNTRELLDIDDAILKNSQEIARLTQELGILAKELEQKEKIIDDLKLDLQKKQDEIEEKKKQRELEKQRLNQLIAEREAKLKELEDKLADLNQRPPTPPPEPKPVVEEKIEAPPPPIEIEDEVDEMLAKYIEGCPVPIKRLGNGYYMFGTKKIYAKILNGKLVIRVGGGYMDITEFIKNYADAELIKVRKRREQGLDIFTGKPVSESNNKTMKSPKGGKGGRDSKAKTFIKGTDAPTQLSAEDIKAYKGK